MKKWIRDRIFFIYIALAFMISWMGWTALIVSDTEPGFFNAWKLLAAFGPSLAGLLVIALDSGKSGLQKLWSQLTCWRISWQWYALSLVAPPVLMLMSLGIHTLLGGEGLIFNDPAEIYRVVPVFFLVLIFSVFGEELGWRGFALPYLQARFSALNSSLILGVIWAIWHLPLFWIPGDFHQQLSFTWFFLQTMAITLLYTWVYNSTQGSLFMILLLHTASNTAFGVLPMLPDAANGSTRPVWILNVLLIIAAAAVIGINGVKTLSRQEQNY